MQFTELTQYFEKLEGTSSRLSLIEILAELFRKTPAEEIEKIVYLIQGRLAPFLGATWAIPYAHAGCFSTTR